MPPNTRKAPKTGAEGGASSSAALEDEVDVGVSEDWNDAARDAARGRKAAMRKEHLAVILPALLTFNQPTLLRKSRQLSDPQTVPPTQSSSVSQSPLPLQRKPCCEAPHALSLPLHCMQV